MSIPKATSIVHNFAFADGRVAAVQFSSDQPDRVYVCLVTGNKSWATTIRNGNDGTEFMKESEADARFVLAVAMRLFKRSQKVSA